MMARTNKPGGFRDLCIKAGINHTELLRQIQNEIGENTLKDWARTKPNALRVLINGAAAEIKDERSMWLVTNTAGWGRYVPAPELANFLTEELGEGWQISDGAVYDAGDNKAFSIKNLGDNPVIIL